MMIQYAIVTDKTGNMNIITYDMYDPDIHELDSIFNTSEEAKYFLNILSELKLRNP